MSRTGSTRVRLSPTHKAIMADVAAAGAAGLELPASYVSAATLYRYGLVTREIVGRFIASRYYAGQSAPRSMTHTIRGRERTVTIYRYRLAAAEVAS